MEKCTVNFEKKLQISVLTAMTAFCINSVFAQQADVAENVRSAITDAGRVEVLVKLKEQSLSKAKASSESHKAQIHSLQNSVLSILNRHDFQLHHQYRTIPGLSGLLFESGLRKLQDHPQVESIMIDMAGQGGLLQSVPAVQADVVHNMGFSGQGIVVGVLDSGVNLNHVDLKEDIVHQYHFLNRGTNVGTGAADLHGHGSNVTGIVTSDGKLVAKGVAPDAQIVAIRVLDENNRGWVSDWIAGVDYIVANNDSLKVAVINMSLVTDAQYSQANCDGPQSLFASAVRVAKGLGIVIFASSGNTGSTTSMTAPACLSDVVAVGAVYDSDLGREPNSGTYRTLFGSSWPTCADETTSGQTLACFTSRNESLDLIAPGSRITSTGLAGVASTFRGTSQASPHAAGVAALMLQKDLSLSPDEIVSILKNSSVQVQDPVTGLSFPLLNALEAIGQVTAVTRSSDEIPESFVLEQNFPNPLRTSTAMGRVSIIRFRLSGAESVTLAIYDLLGRKVKQLVHDFRPAGAHQVIVDGAELPNGIYFYKLQVGSLSRIRKMIVLR